MYNIAAKSFIISSFFGDARRVAMDKEESGSEKIIKKHIESGDYFRALASSLNLTAEIMSIIKENTEQIARSAKDIEQVNERNIKKLQSLRDDLEFLQKKYKIVEKG